MWKCFGVLWHTFSFILHLQSSMLFPFFRVSIRLFCLIQLPNDVIAQNSMTEQILLEQQINVAYLLDICINTFHTKIERTMEKKVPCK